MSESWRFALASRFRLLAPALSPKSTKLQGTRAGVKVTEFYPNADQFMLLTSKGDRNRHEEKSKICCTFRKVIVFFVESTLII